MIRYLKESFSKKPEIKPGQKWSFVPSGRGVNPFLKEKDIFVEIVAVKEGWINYDRLPRVDDGSVFNNDSMKEPHFRNCYELVD